MNTASVRPHSPVPSVLNRDTEQLLSRLCVDVASFSVGTVSPGVAPRLPGVDQVIVMYVISGTGSLEWSGRTILLDEGMIAVIPSRLQTMLRCTAVDDAPVDPGMASHTETADAADNLMVASAIVAASVGHGLGYFEGLQQPLVEDSNDAVLQAIFGGILTEIETPGIGSKCIVEALMKQVLIVLLRRTLLCQRQQATPLYLTIANPSLAKVINVIQQGHAERLSVSGLARMVGMTPFGLTREFEGIFGQSLLDYIQSVRLHQATNLLIQTDLPVKFIAASVGFASRSHFSRVFRKCRGEDPTSFRKSNAAYSVEPFPRAGSGGLQSAGHGKMIEWNGRKPN